MSKSEKTGSKSLDNDLRLFGAILLSIIAVLMPILLSIYQFDLSWK